MLSLGWDVNGKRWPLTVLHLDGCRVIEVKDVERNGYTALTVGVCPRKAKHVDRAVMGQFAKSLEETQVDVPYPYRLLRRLEEFRVSPDAVLPVGTPVNAAHFAPGQLVDVQGTTRGKGMQGVMKRHGFKGGPASHGASKSHRTPGSIGNCAKPAKVFKGTKMAGKMGNRKRTQQNLTVHKIDTKRNLVILRGCIPGANGSIVRLTDSIKARSRKTNLYTDKDGPLHYPTMDLNLQEALPDELYWEDEPLAKLYS